MFHTLHEFVLHVEGISYLVSLLVLVSFIAFWRFLMDREGSH